MFGRNPVAAGDNDVPETLTRCFALNDELRACFVSAHRPVGGETSGPSSSDDWVAVVVPLQEAGLTRLCAWFVLPLRLAMAERRLARAGILPVARFACYPDLKSPTLVYQLRSAARRYAEDCLIPTAPHRLARRALSTWAGCDPTVGGIVIVGMKQ